MSIRSLLVSAIVPCAAIAACGGGSPATAVPAHDASPMTAAPAHGAAPASSPEQTDVGLTVPHASDLSHVQPAIFAAALAHDPARIFAYLRDHVAYEAYPGALRGPRGTLLALAGNSVDRASLLAVMLQAAGQRVRFARGVLPEADARRLVMSMWTVPSTAASTPAAPAPPPQGSAAAPPVFAAVRRDYGIIRDQLQAAAFTIPAPGTPSIDSLVKETQDHFWLQSLVQGAWVDLDPSFDDAVPGRSYAPASATFDALPEAMFDRVELRVRIEEYTGDSPSSRVVLSYEAKSADLSGVALLLSHHPEEWTGPVARVQDAISSAAHGTGRVKPVLWAAGRVITGAPFRQRPPSTVGLGSIGSMLSGGTRHALPLASAEAIELEFIGPAGRREMVRRDVFDLVGPADRASGATILGNAVAARATAADSVDVTSRIFSLLFETGAVAAVHARDLPPPPSSETPDVRAALLDLGLSFCLASDAVASRLGAAGDGGVRFYFDSPRVVIVDVAQQPPDRFRLAVDLRRDSPRAVAVVDGPSVFLARVARGVVEGTLERALIDYVQASSGETGAGRWRASTSTVFDAAAAARVAPALLQAARGHLDPAIPGDVLARVDRDTGAGFLVVAPERPVPVDGAARFAWWRVDPKSGETTAVGDDGLHQGEYVAVVRRGENGVEAVDLTYVGTFGRVLLMRINPATWPGGIAALLDLLRREGWDRDFRPWP
jgi:hypothetical protein